MRIKLDLVPAHVTPDGPLKVTCEGEIVRVDNGAAHVGVAVRIDAYQFEIPRHGMRASIHGDWCQRGGCLRHVRTDVCSAASRS